MNKDEIIYQIYRACRLCGAGAGYKMPIIQSVIDLDGIDIELTQKIRDCVQIEVSHNDRMPPLICELCVDKIHDFYEFRKMCQDTNKRTRLRLGLPLQTKPQDGSVPEECILGNTEPVIVNSDSDEEEPLSTHQTIAPVKTKPKPKSAKTRNEQVKIKIQNSQPAFDQKNRSSSPEIIERRETRGKVAPPVKRPSRQSKTSDDWSLSDLQGLQIQKASPRAGPKSSLMSNVERQKEVERERENEDKTEENSLLVLKRKRPLVKDVVDTPSPPAKKSKSAPEPPPKPEISRPGPKSSKVAKPTPPLKPPQKPPPKAGPKSKKREPSPSPPPQPMPKSKKLEDSPLPTNSRSKKAEESLPSNSRSKKPDESLPTNSRSKKFEESLPTNSRSKKQEVPVLPAPKSKKPEHVPGPASRAKKPDAPAPKSKKREPSPPPKVLVRSTPPPQKGPNLTCNVCRCKTKTVQGLASHKKSHVVTFTPLSLSCNPCELWFATPEEAGSHHRRHTAQGQPYTCNKCYDDFRTLADYDLHLTRNQCLSNYEVPDVKCDDCWKYFPTYKLLEDHKCPGEAGRPGGKCEKCKRTYNLQKTLRAHEIRCVARKKGEPANPDISRKMLPMQVRIARCDSLLRNGNDGRYDVSGVSHRFGLDNNFSYPYLYSMGDVGMKSNVSSSFDPDEFKDEIKNEYLHNEDSYVHWDSDASDESDKSGEIKPVDSLSNLSIKTIFSPKYLGKVPRMKRKAGKGFASILSIDFHGDMESNIDNIIDNLGDESKTGDTYDSDSILDKNKLDRVDSDASVDLFERLKTSLANDMASTEETVEEDRVEECVKNDDINDKISIKAEDSSNEEGYSKTNENISQNGSTGSNDYSPIEQIDNKDETTVVTNAESDENAKLRSPQKSSGSNEAPESHNLDQKAMENLAVSVNNNDSILKEDEKNGLIVSNKIVSEKESLPTGDNVENASQSEGPKKMDVDEEMELKPVDIQSEHRNVEMSESENEKSFPIYDSTQVETNNETEDSQSFDTINHKPLDDFNNEKEDSQSSEAISFKAEDDLNNEKDDSQSSEAISFKAEDDLNNEKDDSQSSDAISYKPVDDLNNEKEESQSSETISFKAENDLNNEKADSQSSFVANDRTNNFVVSENDTADTQSSVPKNESTGKNEDTISNSISFKDNTFTGVDSNDKSIHSDDRFNINNLNDEERQLMAELDAQIGENEPKTDAIGHNNPASDLIGENQAHDDRNDSKRAVIGGESFSDVTSLDVLIQKQNSDLRSLDLDSISDEEFNFDL